MRTAISLMALNEMAHACLWMWLHAGAIWGGKKAGLVTLCMTFSERELIPSYNRLWDRYGKLLHRYLGCLGDHQSTGAGGDATVLKRGVCVCVRVCVLENVFFFLVISVTHKYCIISHARLWTYKTPPPRHVFFFFSECWKIMNSILKT